VTHQLLVCADDVNLLEDNINNFKKNTGGLIDACMEVGWSRSKRRKNTCMFTSHYQNAGQSHNMKIVYRSSEYVTQFRYLKTIVINKNLM
jgi:hypothetical protein